MVLVELVGKEDTYVANSLKKAGIKPLIKSETFIDKSTSIP